MNETTTPFSPDRSPYPDRLALYAAWSEDCESPSPRPLKDWIAEYPHYEQEILQWASQEPLLRYADTLPDTPEEEARFIAKGNLLIAEWKKRYEARFPQTAGRETTSLLSLTDAAKQQGLKLRQVAQMLGLGHSILLKMEKHDLKPETILPRHLQRIANALKVEVQQLRDYLQRPQQLAGGAMYRAEAPPRVTPQQSFADAIADDPEMTDEQKRNALLPEDE